MSEIITLDTNTTSVQYLCERDKRLAKVISMVGPITYSPHENDPYRFLIHEIIEQMLSVKAGQKIFSRLEELCAGEINPDNISALTNEQIRETGTSNAKVAYIRNLTNALKSGTLSFSKLGEMPDNDVICEMTRVRGIGTWTAKMYLMFVLNRPDILPVEDGAFLQVYRWAYKTDDCNPTNVAKKCKKWKPYSSIAARFFYRALDMGITKEAFHLYK